MFEFDHAGTRLPWLISQTDDGYYLVNNYYEMGFIDTLHGITVPGLTTAGISRAKWIGACRQASAGAQFGSETNAVIMAHNIVNDTNPYNWLSSYSWFWYQTIAVGSVGIWRSYADMISVQNLTNNISPSASDPTYGALVANGSPQYSILPFSTWVPNWANKEFFFSGHFLCDIKDKYPHTIGYLNVLLQDAYSFGCFYWNQYETPMSWQRGSVGMTSASPILGVAVPFGYFEFRIKLTDLIRSTPKCYINAAQDPVDYYLCPDMVGPGTAGAIVDPPPFEPILYETDGVTPLLDINGNTQYDPNYVWPTTTTGAGTTLTLAGNFNSGALQQLNVSVSASDPSDIVTIAGVTGPISRNARLDIYQLRVRDISGSSGLMYVGTDWELNSVAGVQTPWVNTTPYKLGEGYDLVVKGNITKAYKSLATPNYFAFKDSSLNAQGGNGYPATFYAKIVIRNPELSGTIISAGGNAGDSSFCMRMGIANALIQACIVFPNYDGLSTPSFSQVQTTVLYTGEAAFMPIIPSDLAYSSITGAGKFTANWTMMATPAGHADIEYELAVVFASATLGSNNRHGIYAYIIDTSGGTRQAFLIGQMLNATVFNNSRETTPAYTGYCKEIALGSSNYRGNISDTFGGDIIEARVYARALTATQLASIVPGSATTDPTSSYLAQFWRLPVPTQITWGSAINPAEPDGWEVAPGIPQRDSSGNQLYFYPNTEVAVSDPAEWLTTTNPALSGVVAKVNTMITGSAVATLSVEIADNNSVDYGSRYNAAQVVPLGTPVVLTVALDLATTPNSTSINVADIISIWLSISNAPPDALTINQIYFQQTQLVGVYQPTPLTTAYTWNVPAEAFDVFTSLYYRFDNPTSGSGGGLVTVELDVYDTINPTDYFSTTLSFVIPPTP